MSLRGYTLSISLGATIVATAALTLLGRADGVQTLRWAHVYETSTPFHRETVMAAREFERRTNGRYRVNVYAASQLGTEAALNEALDLGSIDIIYTGAAFGAKDFPPIAVSDFPYAIEDFAHWKRYRDSDLFAELAAGFLEETGKQIIGLTYYGFRHVTANRAIEQPQDMRDLKIRVPNSPIYMILPDATGANAVPMPFGEVYLALQQGVVDAEENPLTTIRAKRFYEVQSHINLTGHIMPALLTLVSRTRWESLGSADAELLRDIAWRAADRASHSVADAETVLLDWFSDRGVIINAVDRHSFRQAIDAYFGAGSGDYPFDPVYLSRLSELAAP